MNERVEIIHDIFLEQGFFLGDGAYEFILTQKEPVIFAQKTAVKVKPQDGLVVSKKELEALADGFISERTDSKT